MPSGIRYRCPDCDPTGTPTPCCTRARDEHGNPPPKRTEETVEKLLRGRDHHFILLVTMMRPVARELRLAVQQARRRRALKARLKRAGAVQRIDDAREGLVRVEGTVKVLRPATTATGRDHIAAYEWRMARESDTPDRERVRRITTRRGWGRFLIDDGTGVALIDDIFVELRDFKGRETEPYEEGGIAVRDGASVTVLGMARRGAADLPMRAMSSRGYRQRTLPLIFDGSRDAPLVIFAEPNTRDPI